MAKNKSSARTPEIDTTARSRAAGENESNTAKEIKLSLTDRKAWAAQRFRSTEQDGDTSDAGGHFGASARTGASCLSGEASTEPEIDPKAEIFAHRSMGPMGLRLTELIKQHHIRIY